MKTHSLVALLFEARKTTYQATAEGLSLWENKAQFVLLDFNKAILFLADQDVKELLWPDPKNKFFINMDYLVRFLKKNAVCGQMQFRKSNGCLLVKTVSADKGYGPLLYFILAKKSPTKYIGPDENVSDDAAKIWQRFYDNNYPRKNHPINPPSADPYEKPLGYIYHVDDSSIRKEYEKTNVAQLKKEYDVGLLDFQEQLSEMAAMAWPELDPKELADFVTSAPWDLYIAQASEAHFREKYSGA